MLSGLAFFGLCLSFPLSAQVSLDPGVDVERVSAIRASILEDPTSVRKALSDQVHPAHRERKRLTNALVADIAEHGIAVEGCGSVVGFYSPITHLWLAVDSTDPGSSESDASYSNVTLGTGFTAGPDRMVWWPDIMILGEDIKTSIQVSTDMQVRAFQAYFSDEEGDCPEVKGGAFSPNHALTQAANLSDDVVRVPARLHDAFVKDFGDETGTDLSGWGVHHRLPNTGEDWVVFFTSGDVPGVALAGNWEHREDGNVHYTGHIVIPFLATKQEAE